MLSVFPTTTPHTLLAVTTVKTMVSTRGKRVDYAKLVQGSESDAEVPIKGTVS